MTRPTRIETEAQGPGSKIVVAAGRPKLPAFLIWIVSLALAQPVAFPLMVGVVGGALADSISGFAAGVVIGLLMRFALIAFRIDDGVA